jgi:putative FmdB family regulatory protein
MATYEYQCSECGRFDVRLAIGTAPERHRCPTCAGSARRAFSSPSLVGGAPATLRRLRVSDERSQDIPELVSHVPARARPTATPAHPALARLPRP